MSNMNNGRDTIDKVLDLVCEELDGIAKQSELTPVTLKYLDKLVDIKKDIAEIRAMEEYQTPEENMEMMSNGYYRSNGYSNTNGMTRMNGMRNNGYSNWGGNRGYIIQPYNTNTPYYDGSMNEGGMGNGYSNRMYMNSVPHYSRTGSEHEMIQNLRELAASASQEKKTLINNFITQLEATK